MATYVKFELSDGTTVYIESTDAPRGNSGLIPRSAGEAADQAGHPFSEAIAPVSKMAQDMLAGFRGENGEAPSEVSVSFGLKAVSDLGGLVVARAGGDTNYNVTLRWHKEKPEDKPADEKKE